MAVLALMDAGSNNREIAYELFAIRETAKAHVRNILDTMDVSNRAQALTLASRNELVD